MPGAPVERWGTQLGAILAVAGSAVGLGNFLRFPGRAALYGGGAFMIPYFVSLVLLGIPICWIEWTLGRQATRRGLHSAPAIFAAVHRSTATRLFGALAVFIPVVIYSYYVFIEAWCLKYAWDYLVGSVSPPADPTQHAAYFAERFNAFVGVAEDGSLLQGLSPAVVALGICYGANFYLVYRGITAGIERFCSFAMPALIFAAGIVLIRVLTLGTPDPQLPEQNVLNGLGFMWNPKGVRGGGTFSALYDPQVWLEAAGQIFFSLSVGFGIIVTYASYLEPDDDVVLSGLTASATNEFCEVCLGGLITIPAAFVFLGAEPLARVAGSSIGLGFHAVPVIFERLPFGHAFGVLWFGLLFLAAITSSISMLQPAVAFFEEGLGLRRGVALLALLAVTGLGSLLVVGFSRNTVALDVMDFWVGSTALVVLALFEVILFGWIVGAERGIEEANRGSALRIPRLFAPVIRYVCPALLLSILAGFAIRSFPSQARAVVGSLPARTTAGFLGAVFVLFVVLVFAADRRWEESERPK